MGGSDGVEAHEGRRCFGGRIVGSRYRGGLRSPISVRCNSFLSGWVLWGQGCRIFPVRWGFGAGPRFFGEWNLPS